MRISYVNGKEFRLGVDMLDITAPEVAEVQIRTDEKTIWVNIDGICVLRASKIGAFTLTDLKP